MDYNLLVKIAISYFSGKENKSDEEKLLLNEFTKISDEFVVKVVTREDLTAVGFDGDSVDDVTMSYIANKMGDYMSSDDYWDAARCAAERYNVKPINEEEED